MPAAHGFVVVVVLRATNIFILFSSPLPIPNSEPTLCVVAPIQATERQQGKGCQVAGYLNEAMTR